MNDINQIFFLFSINISKLSDEFLMTHFEQTGVQIECCKTKPGRQSPGRHKKKWKNELKIWENLK